MQNPRLTSALKYLLFGLTFYFNTLISLAQQNKIDSLLLLLKTGKQDTTRLLCLNMLSREYENTGSYDSSILYANSALKLGNVLFQETTDPIIRKNLQKGEASAYNNIGNVNDDQGNYREALKNHLAALKIREAIGDKKGLAASYNNIGNVYYGQGNFPEALKNYRMSLKIEEVTGDKEGVAASHNNIGMIYTDQGNYQEALKNYYASLKIRESIGDKKGETYSYNGIGNVYETQGNYDEALKNYFASLKIDEARGNKADIASSYNNIGSVYFDQGNYQEALKSHKTSLKIKETIGDKAGIASSYSNIGKIYSAQKNYQQALKNYFASLAIEEAIGNKTGIASSYVNIGEVFTKQNKYKEAEEYLIKAKELSNEIGYKESLRDAYQFLTELDSDRGNYKGAYDNHKLFILYRDSLNNEEVEKKMFQSQMIFDFEKREAATKAAQDNKDAIAAQEEQKQKVILILVSGFLFLVLVLALLILRGYRQKQKANVVITKQKSEVEKQKGEVEKQKYIIEEKNKDITNSINYAKRIQNAMLPHHKDILEAFPQSFILYKPKDIVSGDFYFFYKKPVSFWGGAGGKVIFIASVDCTGHGVPGAFMSMIGAGKLNDAVHASSDTSEILSLLNRGIKTALKQSESETSTKDGMDIALCAVDTETRIVKYAAANRPIWIIRSGQTEVEEIKATKKAIGGFTENNQHFDTHEIKLQKGDTFYLSTDGYADTFGGKTNKKLTTKKFKEILLSIQDKTMPEQEKHLDNFIEDWKSGTEQVDDILVIGVRV